MLPKRKFINLKKNVLTFGCVDALRILNPKQRQIVFPFNRNLCDVDFHKMLSLHFNENVRFILFAYVLLYYGRVRGAQDSKFFFRFFFCMAKWSRCSIHFQQKPNKFTGEKLKRTPKQCTVLNIE